MSDTNNLKGFGADKIALLGLLASALLTARFVVGLKSAVVLSEPVRLRRTNLSVSVPTGNGWQSDDTWDHDGGVAELHSDFIAGGSQPTARVTCLYMATADVIEPLMRFEQVYGIKGELLEEDRIRTDTLVFEWVRVRGHQTSVTMFFGTAVLPDATRLNIEVIETTGDVDQARKVFKLVVQSVHLEPDAGPDRGLNAAGPPTI